MSKKEARERDREVDPRRISASVKSYGATAEAVHPPPFGLLGGTRGLGWEPDPYGHVPLVGGGPLYRDDPKRCGSPVLES